MKNEKNDDLLVAGIGASAGGVEALESMFRTMPADPGLALVIVPHLAAGRESLMVEILGRVTKMPVLRAEDGMALERDHTYVTVPDALLTLEGGKLRVRPAGSKDSARRAIDTFLASLAEDCGHRSIAIILSGTGTDGTLGLKAVKEAGGLTIAQGSDHGMPRYDGMPTSAISTGLVDLILPAEGIAQKLVAYARDFGRLDRLLLPPEPSAAPPQTAEEARRTICEILSDQIGHDFSGYKDRTFLRRVQRRMQVLQLTSVEAFIERLREDPSEVTALFRDLLINVTSFFRDDESFESLEQSVVPQLFEGKTGHDSVRVWVPGCSTGEEAYSIAILLRERMDKLRAPPKVQIFASDIDAQALEVARSGRFPGGLLDGISESRRRRFFTDDGTGAFLVAKPVRDMCIFSQHNLIRDPPFSRIDLISCRNLLIYLGADLQSRVLPMFHYALRPGGFLFLGSAENVSQQADLFTPLDRKHRLFRRNDSTGTALEFPLLAPGAGRGGITIAESAQDSTTATLALRRAVEAEVLERFAPAHVVVDHQGDVVFQSPRTGKYLELPAGQPSNQLLLMARKGLRLELRSALQEAGETGHAAIRRHITVEIEDGYVQVVTLTVAPFAGRKGEPLFLVLFNDLGPLLGPQEAVKQKLPGGQEVNVEQLERELRDTREHLQSTIEEYETAIEEVRSANEELVSLNEELQSTNEELETSKEETQSVNEELQTVNNELGHKIEALDHANNDLRNLFEATQIAIVFLDKDLMIRSFTPACTELFSLIATDRGRPLADIRSHLDHPSLLDDLASVLASGKPLERQVSLRDDSKHYLLRILPYRVDNTLNDGVVVTCIDTTTLVEAERHQRTLVQELNHRVRNLLAVVLAIARQTLVRSADLEAFTQAFVGRIETMSRAYGLIAREEWGDVLLQELAAEALATHGDGKEGRITCAGPRVLLRPKAAVALGMVLHELATNAMKYGSLSVPDGRVRFDWRIEERGDGRHLAICWEETGGPKVEEPKTEGFGSALVDQQLRHELSGKPEVVFRPEGLLVRASIPWTPTLLA
ncbi:MAG: CheR family methyltransferase [Geminicoccaceae bacterium]